MAQSTLIKQTLTVKKVISKAASKFGKASIIVPLNGKDEFLGLNDGVDETAFSEGSTYNLELSVSKTGKRYVNKILGEATVAAEPVVEATAEVKDAIVMDRDTRITLMNIGNIAGALAAGDLDSFSKAFDHVKAKYKEEGIL